MSAPIKNLDKARRVGAYWEQCFCDLAHEAGLTTTRHQEKVKQGTADAVYIWKGQKRFLILPDVSIWQAGQGHHEIKHKNPTKDGMYGLERYRMLSLFKFARMVAGRVFYTIHNHGVAPGGVEGVENRLEDWVTADILHLAFSVEKKAPCVSFINGERKETECLYWPQGMFWPLYQLFEMEKT